MARPTQKVAIWALDDRRKYRKRSGLWVVRWTVESIKHQKPFATKLPAEQYRAELIRAQAAGERFDRGTGEPVSWRTDDSSLSVWAKKWLDDNWATWKPRTRRSYAEAIERLLPLAVSASAPEAPEGVRTEVRRWLASGHAGNPAADCPAWITRWGLRLEELDAKVCRRIYTDLAKGADGAQLAANTAKRFRSVAKALLTDAVEEGHLASLTWPTGRRTTKQRVKEQAIVESATTRNVPSHTEALATIRKTVNAKKASLSYETVLLIIYYAGLRPSEATTLEVRDLTLPKSGWGSAIIRQSFTAAGVFSDVDERVGSTKTGRVRRVPLHPELVAHLVKFLDGRKKGLVAPNSVGKPVDLGNLERSWNRSRWPHTWTIYDLRAATSTLWVNSGVPVALAAQMLDNSPEVLLNIYAGVTSEDTDIALGRIEIATDARAAAKKAPVRKKAI